MAIEIAPSTIPVVDFNDQTEDAKIGKVENPNPEPNKAQSPWYSIDFTSYLGPFIQLQTVAMGGVKSASSLAYKNIVVVNEFTVRWLSAGYEVFLRLIFSPEFDPATKDFSNKIDYLEGRLPKLQSQFLKITTTRFCSDYMILRDLEALEVVGNEIKQTYDLLVRYAKSTGRPVPPYPIHPRVAELKAQYEVLENKRKVFIGDKQENLLEKFQGIADMFIQAGVPLPSEIHRDLSKMLEKIKVVLFDQMPFKESYKQKLMNARKKLRDLHTLTLIKDVKKGKQIEGVQPLKLVNIGNSCYMDGAIQALLCVDKVCDILRKPIDPKGRSPEVMKHVQAIQEELLKFIESKTIDFDGKLTLMELMLLINRGRGGPSLHRLRDAFFKSGLHHSLSEYELYAQHDAAYIMELMMDELLPFGFKAQKHCTTDVFPGLDFVKNPDSRKIMQIPFAEHDFNDGKGSKKLKTLKNLIFKELEKTEKEEDPNPEYHLEFNPKEAVEINKEKAAPFLESAPQKLSEYHTVDRLMDLQPVMVLQIKRFNFHNGTVQKDSSPVILPENGIIDLTPYYDAPNGQPKKAMYKIKSYVAHRGGYGGGHYVSYVEKGGKYFYCNDFPPFNEEISREEFLTTGYKKLSAYQKNEAQQAYLIVLERLTPEEVTELEAEAAKKEAEAAKKIAAKEKSKQTREKIREAEKKKIAEAAKAGG